MEVPVDQLLRETCSSGCVDDEHRVVLSLVESFIVEEWLYALGREKLLWLWNAEGFHFRARVYGFQVDASGIEDGSACCLLAQISKHLWNERGRWNLLNCDSQMTSALSSNREYLKRQVRP